MLLVIDIEYYKQIDQLILFQLNLQLNIFNSEKALCQVTLKRLKAT